MQYVLHDPDLKLYYNEQVYSPGYSSIGTILIADKLIKDGKKPTATILDVGCGSGVLGLGVKKLNPEADVTLSDIWPEAVRISKLNAKRNGLKVKVVEADLLPKGNWDIIVANLPSFDEEQMEEALHGPKIAYLSPELGLYKELFKQIQGVPGEQPRCRALVAECQPRHQDEFLRLSEREGLVLVLRSGDSFGFQSNHSQPKTKLG